jgi:Protein kinase domain/FHA domain
MARLVLNIPGRAPVELPAQGKLVLGTHPERTDITLEGQGVAEVHCAIGRLKGGGWALRDLGSEYGTIVNGHKAEATKLKAGDVLMLGSLRIEVVDPSAEDPTPAAPRQTSPAPPPKPPARPSQPARGNPVLPGYRLDRRIGKGGMGEVWLAQQVSLDRKVAIKLLNAKLEADPVFVSRFQAEARAAASLSHPNVVTVHDVGEEAGHHFLTMEYMAGGCLETRLASLGPIPWREALRILLDAARGLEFAESRGMVHRDIKPANLMLTEEGITKICDLGLAVQVEQGELSADGKKIFGTPHFIAPEVVRGEKPDPRSDLFSLGATAYRILSGHTPFEGSTTKEILRRLLSDEPEPLDEVATGVPAGVAEMVMGLLEKDPIQRTPSAAVLAREIERLIAEDGAPRTAAGSPGLRGSRAIQLVGVGIVLLAMFVGAKSMLEEDDPPDADPEAGPRIAGESPTDPVEDPGPVDDGEPASQPDVAGEDTPVTAGGDEAAKLVELEAQNELLRLRSRQLTDDERVSALRSLSERFLGTDAAEEARGEADDIEQRVASLNTAELAMARQRAELLARMREATRSDADPPRPGDALRAMRAVPEQEAWENDGEFMRARLALRDEVLDAAADWADHAWQRAGELERAGNFEAMVETCRQIVALTDLPEFDIPSPAGADRLRTLADGARTKKDGAAELETTFLTEQVQADRTAMAKALGGAQGLEHELATCDFAAAEQRLLGLQARLRTPAARARIAPWLEDVVAAREALHLLVSTWEAGSWKRRTVRLPDGSAGDVIGAAPGGLRFQADDNASLMPWSAFGGHPDVLDNLYRARLDRDWSREELTRIAALLRLQAVVQAAADAGQLLSPGSTARFSTGEAEDLAKALDRAEAWATRGGDPSAIDRERAAIKVLSQALLAVSGKRWSEATGRLERLLKEHDDSLLVALLSDGSAW